MDMGHSVLYIIVPCFNEQDTLPASNRRLQEVLDSLVADATVSASSRILYVDDGSTDGTWPLISDYASGDRVCALRLAGNAGHQNALLAGLEVAVEHADVMITLDADLQDDVDAMHQMLRLCAQGCDIVYGVRRDRSNDTWLKRNTARVFYRLMSHLGVQAPAQHADYRLMTRRAVAQLLRYRERNLYLRGLVTLVGYRSACIYYDRAPRRAGASKYPLRKMMSFAVDGITSFSIKPVRMVLSLGIVFLVIALAMLAYALVAYFTGRAVSGWASMILSLWFIGGCILIGLGVVGEYIGKIYIEVKDRPRYNIEQKIIK